MTDCQCMHCRYSRKEISKDFYQGYLIGQKDSDVATLRELHNLGFKPSGLSSEKEDVGHLMAVIGYNIDATESELYALQEKKNGKREYCESDL